TSAAGAASCGAGVAMGDGSNVEGDLFTFQIKEGRVDSRQTATLYRRFLVHLVLGSRLGVAAITGNWRGRRRCTVRPATLRVRSGRGTSLSARARRQGDRIPVPRSGPAGRRSNGQFRRVLRREGLPGSA